MKKFIIPFFCLLLAASILRLWHLESPDINPDEDHYIQDAVRLSHGDPYISVRYHTFKHGEPSIGHPFLVQVIGANVFKIFGYSNFTARLPQALAGILTVVTLLLFNKNLGGRVAFVGALLLAILPFTVRYSRDAHLDSIFALFLTSVALFIWRYNSSRNWIWLVLSGVFVGFAISTKLDGVIALILALTLIFSSQFNSNSIGKDGLKYFSTITAVILLTSFIIFFLLNDPTSYLGAVVKPADPNYTLMSAEFWTSAFKGYKFWGQVGFYLLSPAILFVWLFSLVYLIRNNNNTSRFLIIWQLVLLPLIFFHGPGLSGPYGLLPIIPPIMLTLAYLLRHIFKEKLMAITVFLLLLTLPFTSLYGLYIKPLPYHVRDTWNRTLEDIFYLEIINEVNNITPPNGKVYLLPQTNYPIVHLRSDISWNYSEPEKSDTLVVGSFNSLEKLDIKLSLHRIISKYQDGENLIRYVFYKRN